MSSSSLLLISGDGQVSPLTKSGDVGSDDWPLETAAFIYWTVSANANDILEAGEHANLAIIFAKGDLPAELDTIRIELIVSSGAALTIERQIPNLTTEVVDLG